MCVTGGTVPLLVFVCQGILSMVGCVLQGMLNFVVFCSDICKSTGCCFHFR